MTQQDAAFAAELEASGMTLDALIEGMQGTLSILLGLGAALNVVKIVVGVLGIRKAAQPATFFVVWGVVFLLLGVLGMMFSGVASVFGLCDLAGGVFGPGLFLWGGHPEQARFPADAERRTGSRGAGSGIRLASGAQRINKG